MIHIEKARELLDQADTAGNTPRALTCLYEAIVYLTQAINELESARDKK